MAAPRELPAPLTVGAVVEPEGGQATLPARDTHTQADIDFHDATATLYEAVLEPIFGPYAAAVRDPTLDRLLRQVPGHDALDVGCGTGSMSAVLAARGFDVTGIDHSLGMLDLARQHAEHVGLDKLTHLIRGDVRRLPFADERFSLVTCQGVLHHIEDLDIVLGEMYRVLKPGAALYIAEPCEGTTPVSRAWNGAVNAARRLRDLAARPRRRPAGNDGPATRPPMEHDDHEEAPLEPQVLLAQLHRAGFAAEVEYWTLFGGLRRLPTAAQPYVVRALSRPWRHRRGDLMIVTGRRR